MVGYFIKSTNVFEHVSPYIEETLSIVLNSCTAIIRLCCEARKPVKVPTMNEMMTPKKCVKFEMPPQDTPLLDEITQSALHYDWPEMMAETAAEEKVQEE